MTSRGKIFQLMLIISLGFSSTAVGADLCFRRPDLVGINKHSSTSCRLLKKIGLGKVARRLRDRSARGKILKLAESLAGEDLGDHGRSETSNQVQYEQSNPKIARSLKQLGFKLILTPRWSPHDISREVVSRATTGCRRQPLEKSNDFTKTCEFERYRINNHRGKSIGYIFTAYQGEMGQRDKKTGYNNYLEHPSFWFTDKLGNPLAVNLGFQPSRETGHRWEDLMFKILQKSREWERGF